MANILVINTSLNNLRVTCAIIDFNDEDNPIKETFYIDKRFLKDEIEKRISTIDKIMINGFDARPLVSRVKKILEDIGNDEIKVMEYKAWNI